MRSDTFTAGRASPAREQGEALVATIAESLVGGRTEHVDAPCRDLDRRRACERRRP